MTIQFEPQFLTRLKKINVRIRKSFKEKIEVFRKNPYDSDLKNHALKNEWEGYRSIHIRDPKNDYCAIYREVKTKNESVALFVAIGTHSELFEKNAKRDDLE